MQGTLLSFMQAALQMSSSMQRAEVLADGTCNNMLTDRHRLRRCVQFCSANPFAHVACTPPEQMQLAVCCTSSVRTAWRGLYLQEMFALNT